MHGDFAVIIKGEEVAVAEFQRFVDELLWSPLAGDSLAAASRHACARAARARLLQYADDDFDVVFAETVEPKSLAGGINLPVRPHFGVAVPGRPFGNVRMKPLAVLHHGGEQQQVTASFQLQVQAPANLITGLRLNRHMAIRTI